MATITTLTQILLVENQIESLDNLKQLAAIKGLSELDFTGCPVANEPNYRPILFDSIKSLEILDQHDLNGEFVAEEEDDEESEFDGGDDASEEEDYEEEEEEESSEKPKNKGKKKWNDLVWDYLFIHNFYLFLRSITMLHKKNQPPDFKYMRRHTREKSNRYQPESNV